jgi:hypothetical protein
VLGALAVMGSAAQTALADGWFWRGSPRIEVVLRPSVVRERVIATRPMRVEVRPMELRLSAYRSGDRIIVVASGSNRTTGFTTSLESCDTRDRTPTLVLRNFGPGDDCAGQVITRFNATASIQARHGTHCVRVNVLGRIHEVHVTSRRHS